MRSMRAVPLFLVLTLGLHACTTVTGRTAGRTIDDAAITATVKAKLAGERLGTPCDDL